MSETTKTLSNYVKTALALIKGDKDEQLILHNERRAKSAIKRQINNLEDRKTSLELELNEAEEKLVEAKYPTTFKLGESSNYCSKIREAQELVDSFKNTIKDVEESITYFEELQKEMGL